MINDMQALRLRRALNGIAEEGAPGGVDLWPSVSEAVSGRRRVAGLRKAWTAAAVGAVAVASIAAVTAGPSLVDEMGSLLSSNYRGDGEFGEPIEMGLTQTIEGVTATLDTVQITELAGTDGVVREGRIGVVWTLYGMDRPLSVGSITDGASELQDSQGRTLPQMIGIGWRFIQRNLPLPPRSRLHRIIHDYAHQPRPERPVRIKLADATVNLHKRSLRHVLGHLPVTCHQVSGTHSACLVDAHQRLEARDVSRPQPLYGISLIKHGYSCPTFPSAHHIYP